MIESALKGYEDIASKAIAPTQQTTQFKALISQMVTEEVARQMVEKDTEIDRLQSQIEELETCLEEHQIITGRERAFDRQRISRLETQAPALSNPTAISHLDRLFSELASRS